jgi:hypothetical protein
MQVSEPFEFVLSTQTQNLYLRVSEWLCVFSSCPSGSSSSLLLLSLMGEFTSHMSVSESSLQLPTSESESFKFH